MKKIIILITTLFIFLASNAQTSRGSSMTQPPNGSFISKSGSFTQFTTTFGSASTAQFITFTGTSLTNNVTVTISSSGLEISKDNVTYTTSLTYNQSGGNASGTIWARIPASATNGSYGGNVSIQSIGANTVNVPYTAIVGSSPSMSVSTNTITNLNSFSGAAGTPQTFDVTFANVPGSLTVTTFSPVEISQDGGSTWSSTTQVFSTGSPKTISSRVASTASIGSISGTITVQGPSITTQNISVSGTVSSAPSFAHNRALPIPTSVTNTNLSNFTMVVQGTIPGLATIANGGFVNSSVGNDIVFSSNNLGSSLLNWELESYDPTTGTIVAHVKIPTISSSTTTTVYMLYGNSSISSFQGGASGSAYDGNYAQVNHFSENLTGAGQTVSDFSGNSNNLTSVGTWSGQSVAGKIGNGISLLALNGDYFNMSSFSLTGDFTIEGWFYVTDVSQNCVGFGNSTGSQSENWFGSAYRLFNGSGDMIVDGTNTTINTWTHLAITRSGSSLTVYHNGVIAGTGASTSTPLFNQLGRTATQVTSDIRYDERRRSTIARSSQWIGAQVSNVNGTWPIIGAQN